MTSRTKFLQQLWTDTIDAYLQGHWIANSIRDGERDPGGPLAEVGEVLKRLRAAGATDQDLGFVARATAYEAVFSVLYQLEDPGVDDTSMLFEELLIAGPSGLEGRPGSANTVV